MKSKWRAGLITMLLLGSSAAWAQRFDAGGVEVEAVSYTHLDVYKRQAQHGESLWSFYFRG